MTTRKLFPVFVAVMLVAASLACATAPEVPALVTALPTSAPPTQNAYPTLPPEWTATAIAPVAALVSSPSAGKWQVSFDQSAFDDSRIVFVSVKAETQIEGWLDTSLPQLVLRCKEGETSVYVVTGMSANVESGLADQATVRLRFDSEPAEQQLADESTDNKALFLGDAMNLIWRMSQHARLVFGFTPFNASPVDTSFDLRGLNAVIQPLAEACHWSSQGNRGGNGQAGAVPSPTLVPTATPYPTPEPTATPLPAGSAVMVEDWLIKVDRVEMAESTSYAGSVEKAKGRFAILYLTITNRGTSPGTFVAFGLLQAEDAEGRQFEENPVASIDIMFTHDYPIPADINPDAVLHTVAVYDISNGSAYYRLVPARIARSANFESLVLPIP